MIRAAVVLAGWLFATSLSPATASPRPNIVVILADDLGYGDLGCYGATKVRTPNIDRLARQGMRFTDAHSPSSVCTPSRYNLLTGRYAWRTWVGNRNVWSDDPLLIEPDRLTLPRLLKQAGYGTACLGKWHLGFGAPGTPGWDDRLGPDYNRDLKPGPLDVGFDYFWGIPHVGQHPHVIIENRRVLGLKLDNPMRLVPDPRTAGRKTYLDRPTVTPAHKFEGGTEALYDESELGVRIAERAVKWLGEQKDTPFFLYVALRNVHMPLKPHPRFQKSSAIGVYGDFINELDWSVGEILGALQKKGLEDDTLVIFTSDNGGLDLGPKVSSGHRPNGKLRGHKTEVYEGGQRVPFLARWPARVKAGAESGELIALTDLMATVAELLGQPLPKGAGEDSFSFLPALLGSKATQPKREFLIHDGYEGLFAVHEGPWKLIPAQGGGGNGWKPNQIDPKEPAGQLYHLTDDPEERTNVYEKHPDVVRRLSATLAAARRGEPTAKRRNIP
jgi:arylsulfatase A